MNCEVRFTNQFKKNIELAQKDAALLQDCRILFEYYVFHPPRYAFLTASLAASSLPVPLRVILPVSMT